ncbi:MAG: flotillin-like protein FloA [Candidatus Eremiobacteraeota bacterium]|nr:flotillin-like protein FloA [Candidatus Eremiobacteraeota bacterium]
MTIMITLGAILFGLIIAYAIISYFIPINLWLQAHFADVHIPMTSLFGMRLRRVDPNLIVISMITAHKAGISLKVDDLESHFLAKGNVGRVIEALVAADRAGIALTFERACAIDLAGRDVLREGVQPSVNPVVISIDNIIGTALDGIQLMVKVKVTVRANIERLVGGATQETIKARVGQGIVAEIGSAKSYKDVLENPDRISARVLDLGLDSGTAYEILSIDVADIDVGKNVGAQLQASQAEADMRTAEAKAREKRAMAEARQEEMKALAEEKRALVIEAEAQVPMALADSLRSGKMGFMDYYNLQNIKADTSMRKSIGSPKAS